MKKLILMLLLITFSSTFADIIHCPTSDNYSFNGKQWEISVEREENPDHCTEFAPPSDCIPTNKPFKYDPATKKIEQSTSSIDAITFSYTEAHVVLNENRITLQCNGQYSSQESGNYTWDRGRWRFNVKNSMEAKLLLNDAYKKCEASSDNTSFNCEPASHGFNVS